MRQRGSMSDRGYKELENGDVQITMSRVDFESVLCTIGIGAGWRATTGAATAIERAHALLDNINAGNPHWRPYAAAKSST